MSLYDAFLKEESILEKFSMDYSIQNLLFALNTYSNDKNPNQFYFFVEVTKMNKYCFYLKSYKLNLND